MRLQIENAMIIINVTFRHVLPTRLQRANAVIIIKCNRQVYSTGLLIFRAVADPRNSGISAKSREIPQKTRNTAKSARNISKYISAKHI